MNVPIKSTKTDTQTINAFLKTNPSVNLKSFNFLKKGAVDQLDWSAVEDKQETLTQLKGLQRLVRVTGDQDAAVALYNKGLHSAYQIASMSQQRFVSEYADCFGSNGSDGTVQAKQTYKKALARKSQTVQTYTAITQQTAPYYTTTAFDNTSVLTTENYAGLPSYEELFGNLDYCNCQDCRSIFSPAAYFVDLMRVQADYVNTENVADQYLLQNRRPDLGEIVLNCDNTNTQISKLLIVNSVLEYQYQQLLNPPSGSSDPVAQNLTQQVYPFNLPLDLPLAQIRQFLAQSKTSLVALWLSLNNEFDPISENVGLATLGLSSDQWNLYSTPATDTTSLNADYGISPSATPPQAQTLTDLTTVTTFLAQTGLSYDQLNNLLNEDLSSQEIADSINSKFFINAGNAAPIAINDNDGETQTLDNLIPSANGQPDYTRLDHVHRFIRLANAINWSFADLDWALQTISMFSKNQVLVTGDNTTLPSLAWMQTLQTKKQLSVNQCCALIHTVKDFGAASGATFFDSIFNNSTVPNPPQWRDGNGQYSLVWNVTTQTVPSSQAQQIQNALSAALQMSHADLITVAQMMVNEQKISYDAQTQSYPLPLTLKNLSTLYRVSLLAKTLGLTINECIVASSLLLPNDFNWGAPSANISNETSAITTLIEFTSWLKSSGLSLAQLQYILTGNSYNATLQNQILGPNGVSNFINSIVQGTSSILLNQQAFNDAVNALLQQSEYSEDAVDYVYGSLQSANYIVNGEVQSVPDDSAMQSIIKNIFPSYTADGDTYVTDLSSAVIETLQSYVNQALDQTTFTNVLANDFISLMRSDNLLSQLWANLQSVCVDNGNAPGVVITTDIDVITPQVESAVFPYIPQTLLQSINNLIQSILVNYYQSQQKTLSHCLAGLYGVSETLIPALEVLGALTFGDYSIEAAQDDIALLNPMAGVPLLQCFLSSANTDQQTQRLQYLQRYAYLFATLSVSVAAANSFIANGYYGFSYTTGTASDPVFQYRYIDIQTIDDFTQFIQTIQDNQNQFLSYLDWVQANQSDTSGQQTRLVALTNWDSTQLQFLMNQSWGNDGAPNLSTVQGVWQLNQWFQFAASLNVNVQCLWQLNTLYSGATLSSSGDNYTTNQAIADALWGGITKTYSEQTNVLSTIQNTVNQTKRDALVPIVIVQLNNRYQLNITNARDLYEYLLIDVEVNGVVQTSYVGEAISAVQLYIYRCLNNLESGVTVSSDLAQWWSWMKNYRVWEANREIFLYPENYIEPDLRENATPEFIQLQNDLKQGDLTNIATVETAFQNYMNGFSDVGNLEIVGSASYDTIDPGSVNSKTLCLIGCTREQPYSYYYLTANFLQSSSPDPTRYIPNTWSPWNSVSCHMNPVGPVMPVFAFGKWFIFWVEQQQSGSTASATVSNNTTISTSQSTRQYTATVYYSYLDFQNNWVTSQALSDSIPLPGDIQSMDSTQQVFWDRVYPVFFRSAQAIQVPYGTDSFAYQVLNLTESTLNQGLIGAFRYGQTNPLEQVDTGLSSCFANVDDNPAYQYLVQFSNVLQQKDTKINLSLTDSVAICEFNGKLYGAWRDSTQDNEIYLGCIDLVSGVVASQKINEAAPYCPNLAVFNNRVYITWTANDSSKQLFYGYVADTTTDAYSVVQCRVVLNEQSAYTPGLAAFNGKLYMVWLSNNVATQTLNIAYLDTVNNSTNTQGKEIFTQAGNQAPALASYNGNLYVAWGDFTTKNLCYGYFNTVSNSLEQICVATNFQSSDAVALTVANNKLYIAWIDANQNANYGWLDASAAPNFSLNNQIVVGVTNYAPCLTESNGQLLISWMNQNNNLYISNNSSFSNFIEDIKLNMQLADSVAICEFNGKLYGAWRDANSSNKIHLGCIDLVNGSATSTIITGESTTQCPNLAVFNNRLYIVWKANDQSNTVYYGYVADSTSETYSTVQNRVVLGEESPYTPSLAVFNGQLYMAWTSNNVNYNLCIAYLDTVGLSSSTQGKVTVGQKLFQAPVLAVYNNNLYVAWGDFTTKSLCYGYFDTVNSSMEQICISTSFQSSNALTLTVVNNKLYIAWTDSKNANYGWLDVSAAPNFSLHDQNIVGVTNYAPCLAESNGQLLISWIGKNDNNTVHITNNSGGSFAFSAWFQLINTAAAPLLGGLVTLQAAQADPNTSSQQVSIEVNGQNASTTQQSMEWSHLILTSNNTGGYDVYYNGILCDGLGNLSLNIPNPVMLGTDGQKQFSGVIQEVLFYNRSLTSTEIAALYNNVIYNDTPQVTHNSVAGVLVQQAFSRALNQTPVVGQPNWYIVEGDDAEFLVAPYISAENNNATYLDCTRLNTTAIRTLSQLLMIEDIDGLLTVSAQETAEIPFEDLQPNNTYIPQSTYPSDTIDFINGPMSQYYWEIFFHAPFLIAYYLNIQQQFEQAKKWYEYIFNPTVQDSTETTNDKYWQFVGLHSDYNSTLNTELSESWSTETQDDLTNSAQLYEYHNDPFDPYAIAQLRPIAYQKTIVIHYIDNIINWADNLFTQYTSESIVEATMLYVLAYDLLGKQPTSVGSCEVPDAQSLNQLISDSGDSLQDLPEFLIAVEQVRGNTSVVQTSLDNPNNYIANDYFCLPENDQFISYWNTVEQRLYDIRNSLNIIGVYQQPALFQPPLNPMQLVQQVASGAPVGQALSALQTNPPYYRFEIMVEKAKEITQSVIQLGQSLLAALEKQDAEALSMLYSTNRQNILALDHTAKLEAVDAANQTIQALQAGLQNAQDRLTYYTNLINTGLSTKEKAQLTLDKGASTLQSAAQLIKGIATVGYLIPTVYGFSDGDFDPGSALSQEASIYEGTAQAQSMAAGLAGSVASYERRAQDWGLQQTLAQDDINQANFQIASAQYQASVAQQELTSLEKDLAQEQNVAQFLRSKFTSQQLYQWMVGQLSATYFQAYQLAYDLATQAQQAWQFEKAVSQTFIQPGYWDSLHQGLLAGEALQLDIQRMENAYMKQNQRRLEIEKTISLKQLDPDAFSKLQSSGSCSFTLSESEFDNDYPGHYCRQIKAVTLSFPVVLGPYQNIHATLTQTSNTVITQPDQTTVQYYLTPTNAGTVDQSAVNQNMVRVDMRANQQIALSQGFNDSGLFELNFNDPRYLPFEGTGAISNWTLSIPINNNPGVLDNLTDVIIRLQYTALQGSSSYAAFVSSLVAPQLVAGF